MPEKNWLGEVFDPATEERVLSVIVQGDTAHEAHVRLHRRFVSEFRPTPETQVLATVQQETAPGASEWGEREERRYVAGVGPARPSTQARKKKGGGRGR